MGSQAKLPEFFPIVSLPSRVLLPGGVLQLQCGPGDAHTKLAERLFWSHSADNPQYIGQMCLFTF